MASTLSSRAAALRSSLLPPCQLKLTKLLFGVSLRCSMTNGIGGRPRLVASPSWAINTDTKVPCIHSVACHDLACMPANVALSRPNSVSESYGCPPVDEPCQLYQPYLTWQQFPMC